MGSVFERTPKTRLVARRASCRGRSVGLYNIHLMGKIPHHLGWMKSYKYWDKSPTSWWGGGLSINGRRVKRVAMCDRCTQKLSTWQDVAPKELQKDAGARDEGMAVVGQDD